TNSFFEIKFRETVLADKIFNERKLDYLEQKNKLLSSKYYNDVWSLIYLSFIGNENEEDFIDILIKNLYIFLSSNRNRGKTHNDLIKIATNFNLIKSIKDLKNFLDQVYGERPSNKYEIRKISLNSPFLGVEEGCSTNAESLSYRVWNNKTSLDDKKTAVDISNLIESINQSKKLNYLESIQILNSIKSDSSIINNFKEQVLINNYFLNNNIDDILKLILEKSIITEYKERSSYLKILLNEFTEQHYIEIENPLKKVNLLHFASILLN
ncbi:hypothetical protein OFN08_18315, partial [Acinetobacter baumannii]|nr:hypothetical protein [Acinetobacter baumannii]